MVERTTIFSRLVVQDCVTMLSVSNNKVTMLQKCNIFIRANDSHMLTVSMLSVFPHDISQKTMQLGSPNLTKKRSTMSHENPFILESKGRRSRSQRLCQCLFGQNAMLPLQRK